MLVVNRILNHAVTHQQFIEDNRRKDSWCNVSLICTFRLGLVMDGRHCIDDRHMCGVGGMSRPGGLFLVISDAPVNLLSDLVRTTRLVTMRCFRTTHSVEVVDEWSTVRTVH